MITGYPALRQGTILFIYILRLPKIAYDSHRRQGAATVDHAQLQRQIELIQALDRIRDSYGDDDDPAAMFRAIAALLMCRFDAHACDIFLFGTSHDGLGEV